MLRRSYSHGPPSSISSYEYIAFRVALRIYSHLKSLTKIINSAELLESGTAEKANIVFRVWCGRAHHVRGCSKFRRM